MKLKFVMTMAAALLATSACAPQSSYDYDDDDGWKTSKSTRVCSDNRGRRVSDNRCGGSSNAYMWYYIGKGGYVPPVGGVYRKDGYGSYKASPAAKYYTAPSFVKSPSSTVSRGGFGSTTAGRSSASVGG